MFFLLTFLLCHSRTEASGACLSIDKKLAMAVNTPRHCEQPAQAQALSGERGNLTYSNFYPRLLRRPSPPAGGSGLLAMTGKNKLLAKTEKNTDFVRKW